MDILVPALSGHNTYVGHFAETIDYSAKRPLASSFFHLAMTPDNAMTWLKTNHIRYIIFTFYDGNISKFETEYPLLKKIFENEKISVYET
jgi:hypothetical protein